MCAGHPAPDNFIMYAAEALVAHGVCPSTKESLTYREARRGGPDAVPFGVENGGLIYIAGADKAISNH